MQHVFEFYIKGVNEEPIHNYFITQSSRHGKVQKILLSKINDFRKKIGMDVLDEVNLEEYKFKQVR